MKLKSKQYFLPLLVIFFSSATNASDYSIDPACAISFNVEDKSVVLPPWTGESQNCVLLELQRERIFSETILPLLENPTTEGLYASSVILLDQADKALADLENDLIEKGEQHGKDRTYKEYSGSWSKYVIVSALWTCSAGPNPGCVASAIATAWATNAYFRAEKSVEKLVIEISDLQSKIALQKAALNQAGEGLPTGLKLTLADFHTMCYAIRDNCIAQ